MIKTDYCTLELEGAKCAETVEKTLGARVRGKRMDAEEKPTGNCPFCNKKASIKAYMARQY